MEVVALEISLFKVYIKAESRVSKYFGIAKDAIIPITTIANINSRREKPFFIFFIINPFVLNNTKDYLINNYITY